MPEYVEDIREPDLATRHSGGWRVIASAWAVVIATLVLFGGFDALASRHAPSMPHQTLTGVVIPRHDPSCGSTGDQTAAATPNCPSASRSFARAEADAEAEAAYGW